jgi:two-component system OmpR family response regulator
MDTALKKILFVDDDEDVHMIIEFCLREIPNVEIRSALSGEEAIGIAISFQPDLILLDVMMPKMDGIATLEALKLLPNSAKTPVVFITAKAQKSEIDGYIKYGVVDVIVKPFDAATLAETVQNIWKKC